MNRSKDPLPKSKSNASDAAWQRAVRWLTVHDRSAHELRVRLTDLGETPAVIDQVLQRLQHLGYLNDERFAQSAAERGAQRGHGSERVHAELTGKGVAVALVDAAIAAAFADERALAQRTLARKFPHAPRTAKERAKAAHFLLNRGFPEAIVLAILGEGC